MALTALWDSNYESTPSNQLDKSLIPGEIHYLKVNIEQRLGQEHFIGPWASPIVETGDTPQAAPSDGRHWPGHTTVALYDIVANRPASDIHTGALFVLKFQEDGATTGSVLQLYDGSEWIPATTDTHAMLGGTTNDDHPQYILLTGSSARNTQTAPFDAGGQLLYVVNVNGSPVANQWITESHVAAASPHSFTLTGGAYDDAAFDLIPVDPSEPGSVNCKLDINRSLTTGAIVPLVDTGHISGLAAGSSASIALSPNGFMPSVRVYCSANQGGGPIGDVPYAPTTSNMLKGSSLVGISINGANLVITNNTTVAIDYRIVQFGFSSGAI